MKYSRFTQVLCFACFYDKSDSQIYNSSIDSEECEDM